MAATTSVYSHRIVLTPFDDGKGGKTLSVDLHGHLARILSLAAKGKQPLSETDPEMGYIKLVAGA